jgi:hypothetical protein
MHVAPQPYFYPLHTAICKKKKKQKKAENTPLVHPLIQVKTAAAATLNINTPTAVIVVDGECSCIRVRSASITTYIDENTLTPGAICVCICVFRPTSSVPPPSVIDDSGVSGDCTRLSFSNSTPPSGSLSAIDGPGDVRNFST